MLTAQALRFVRGHTILASSVGPEYAIYAHLVTAWW